MAAPTATAIRAELEGYGITVSVLTDEWINRCRDEEIIPHIEDVTGMAFDGEETVTEYYSGTGKSILILNRRPVNSIVSIRVVGGIGGDISGLVTLSAAEGIIKVSSNYAEGIYQPLFQKGDKNIEVVYKVGADDYPARVARAIKLLVAAKMLNHIQARTGGGGLGVQAFNRNFGSHGKYTDIRKEMVQTAYALLKKYMTGVVGS